MVGRHIWGGMTTSFRGKIFPLNECGFCPKMGAPQNTPKINISTPHQGRFKVWLASQKRGAAQAPQVVFCCSLPQFSDHPTDPSQAVTEGHVQNPGGKVSQEKPKTDFSPAGTWEKLCCPKKIFKLEFHGSFWWDGFNMFQLLDQTWWFQNLSNISIHVSLPQQLGWLSSSDP